MTDTTRIVITASVSASDDHREREIERLRQGLWACYALAGGDTEHYTADSLSNEDLVPLVIDCVRDLRGLFDAARRDLL